VTALGAIQTALAGQPGYNWSRIVGIKQQAVAAWSLLAAGDTAGALREAKAAADLEDVTEKHPVTPGELLPARELEGDLLLAVGRYPSARAAYEATLRREPGRPRSLFGVARAAELAGDVAAAEGLEAQLVGDACRRVVVDARLPLGDVPAAQRLEDRGGRDDAGEAAPARPLIGEDSDVADSVVPEPEHRLLEDRLVHLPVRHDHAGLRQRLDEPVRLPVDGLHAAHDAAVLGEAKQELRDALPASGFGQSSIERVDGDGDGQRHLTLGSGLGEAIAQPRLKLLLGDIPEQLALRRIAEVELERPGIVPAQ